jgi:RsiW-degrading membrane proteinase PrsW (M82 family)
MAFTFAKHNMPLPMKIQNYMPRQACITFLGWFAICWSVASVIFMGSIITFVVLMPNDQYGWQGIRSAFWSFLPGVLISVYLAFSSVRELRLIKKLPNSAFKLSDLP